MTPVHHDVYLRSHNGRPRPLPFDRERERALRAGRRKLAKWGVIGAVIGALVALAQNLWW